MTGVPFPWLSERGDRDEDVLRLGHKAAWLRWLCAQGEHVPEGFAIPVDTALRLHEREELAVAALSETLAQLQTRRGPFTALAVRASPVHSLPGALLTVLDLEVGGATELTERVLVALDRVLQSATSNATREQLRARELDVQTRPWVGVVVQWVASVQRADDFGAVAFTHDPARGTAGVAGEYALGQPISQVVSGTQRPEPMTRAASRPGRDGTCLEVAYPDAFQRVRDLCVRLSERAEEPLELELLQSNGQIWLVQARPLVLSPRALAHVATVALQQKRPSAVRLLRRMTELDLAALVEMRLPDNAALHEHPVIARGLAASPGVVTGSLVFDLEAALAASSRGPVILARRDATPEDVAAFRASQAVVTTSGGLTSHAAVIARGLRIPAVIGCSDVRLDTKARCLVGATPMAPGAVVAREGDIVTVDAHRGLVYGGTIAPLPVVAAELRELCEQLRPLRARRLFVLGPSRAADQAHAQCALDGIWDPTRAANVRGSSPLGAVRVVGDLETDGLAIGQSGNEDLACPPEHAAAWALVLAMESR